MESKKLLRFLIILIVTIGAGAGAPQVDSKQWQPELKGDVLESTLVRYYSFTLDNPEEFNNGEVPVMTELGPFTYREKRVKQNLKRVAPDQLSYDVHWNTHFLPELTRKGLSEKTEYTQVNVPFVTMAEGLAIVGLPKGFNDILVDEVVEAGEKMYRKGLNFGDSTFHGYNVSLYTEILDDITQGQTEERYPELAGGKFAFLKNKNNTILGNYTVKSTESLPFGQIVSYQGSHELGFYPANSACDLVRGSFDFFSLPRNIKKDTVLNIFLPNNCRTFKMTFVQEDVYRGVPVYAFKFPLKQFSNDPLNPDTSCYCFNFWNVSDPQCLDAGLLDYAGCSKGAPAVGSFPHFLHAHPKHLENVKGLMPNKSLHESEVMIEPITGTPLYAVRRFQLNLRIRPIPTVTQFENVTARLMPIAWFEHILEVPSSVFTEVKEKLEQLNQAKSDKDIYNHDENPVDQVDDNTLGLEVRSGFPGSSSLAAESKSGGEMKSDTSKSSARKLFNCDNRSIILGCVALIFLVRIRTS